MKIYNIRIWLMDKVEKVMDPHFLRNLFSYRKMWGDSAYIRIRNVVMVNQISHAIIETLTNRLIAKCRSTVLPDGITEKIE